MDPPSKKRPHENDSDENGRKKPKIVTDIVDFGSYKGCGTREGVAVGVLVAPPALMQHCKAALDKTGWIKKAGNLVAHVAKLKLSPTELDKLAVSLSPDGCVAVGSFFQNHDDPLKEKVPEALRNLILEGSVIFVPGKRLGPGPSETKHRATLPPPPVRTTPARFRFIELFAGIGGFHLACKKYDGECVFASEINKKASETYFENYGVFPFGDITEIDSDKIPSHDLLTAGFPCQSFSVMGSQEGLGDERGNLFWEIIRIIRHHQPRGILLENVPGLLLNQDGNTFKLILSELTEAGYHVKHQVLSAAGWVPQDRKRLFIVGFLSKEEHDRFSFPIEPPITRCVKDILEPQETIPDSYTLSDYQWEKIRTSAYYLKNPTGRVIDINKVSRTIRSKYRRGFQMCSQFVPQEGKNPRFFTPREAARLQGFPEEFKMPDTEGTFYKQIGNAVCPVVVAEIVHKIMEAWNLPSEPI